MTALGENYGGQIWENLIYCISASRLLYSMHYLPKTAILLLLTSVVVSQTNILARSNLQSVLLTSGFSTALSGFHNVYQPNMLGPGAFWIWNNEAMLSPPGRTLTFEVLLYSSCSSPAQLNITADDSFKAYLDGKLILQGNNWRLIYTITINLTCGSHNLTIVATQGYGQFGPGVIYLLAQDQSSCYNCGLNGFWDYSICSCRCLTICGCASPQVWIDFPACTCRCPTASLGVGVTRQQEAQYYNLLASITGKLPNQTETTCPQGQYFNEQMCSCQCKPRYCRERYIWNSNPSVCQCQFNP